MKPSDWIKQTDPQLYEHVMECPEGHTFCNRFKAFILVVERYESIKEYDDRSRHSTGQ